MAAPPDDHRDAVRFALLLSALPGVGRATTHRLLEHFPTLDALRQYPREQVLTRLKGMPRAQTLVTTLFDDDALAEPLREAETQLVALEQKKIALLTPHHPHWPAGLNDLDRARRPTLLWTYGKTEPLVAKHRAALLAQPPLEEGPFELAQALARRLLGGGVVLGTGAQHGFDVVIQKLAAGEKQPALLMAHTGLGKLPAPLRPVATATVHAGGTMASTFPMEHGPYNHDQRERATVLAALADVTVAVQPQERSAEHGALRFCQKVGRPAFAIGASSVKGVPELRAPGDFDRVVRALAGG